MDALADKWALLGHRSEDLYKGKTEEIIKALKAWIGFRNTRNEANLTLLWDLFDNNDDILNLRDQYGTLEDVRIAPYKAKHVKNVERVKVFREERDKLTLRAHFLLESLTHRGFKWPGLPCTPDWTEMDSEVCAFLKSQDRKFDAEKELEFLEMKEEIAEWRLEHARRETIGAVRTVEGDNAGDHGSTTPPTTVVGFGEQDEDRGSSSDLYLPAPIDVTGLLPRPRAEDSPMSPVSPVPLDSIEEEPPEPEETAEAIALRINNMNITKENNVTEEKQKAQKKSKTKTRNTQRKKAKARANEAAKREGSAGDDDSVKEN